MEHVCNKMDIPTSTENLKEFRKKKNITQEELANILNTTHSTISAYESGKTTILTAFAYQICKRYNISMDYLCGRVKNTR